MSVPVYRWPDGSEVLLDHHDAMRREVRSFIYGKSWPLFCFSPAMKAMSTEPVLYLESPKIDEFDGLLEKEDRATGADVGTSRKKLLGFVLDLGVRRFHPSWWGIVTTHGRPPAVLGYPRWVSDEEWESRYDVARSRLVPGSVSGEGALRYQGPLVGGVDHLFVRHYRDGGEWYAKWNSGRSESGTMSVHSPDTSREIVEGSLEDIVDWCIDYELVLPESRREAWEEQNVVRGAFVLPSPEEVEIFRMLGETLPFFWSFGRLGEWLSARQAS